MVHTASFCTSNIHDFHPTTMIGRATQDQLTFGEHLSLKRANKHRLNCGNQKTRMYIVPKLVSTLEKLELQRQQENCMPVGTMTNSKTQYYFLPM